MSDCHPQAEDESHSFTLTSETNTATVTQLSPGHIYGFQVRARTAAGHGPFGGKVYFQTLPEGEAQREPRTRGGYVLGSLRLWGLAPSGLGYVGAEADSLSLCTEGMLSSAAPRDPIGPSGELSTQLPEKLSLVIGSILGALAFLLLAAITVLAVVFHR